jgi:hypothetical protein
MIPFIIANAGTIASVAGTAASYVGGQQAAGAQSKAAWDNYNIQKSQQQQEAQMQANAAMQEKGERAKQFMLEQAKIKTISGESGISGNSVDALLQDSYMQAGIDITTIDTNRISRGIQGAQQQRAYYAKADQSVKDAYASKPSLLGSVVSIGGDVLKSNYVQTTYGEKKTKT